jgi:hypothetical protein
MSFGRWGEVDGGEWCQTGGSDAWARLKKSQGRRGVWWFSWDMIGWGGGAPWTVSWTESNDANIEFDRVVARARSVSDRVCKVLVMSRTRRGIGVLGVCVT